MLSQDKKVDYIRSQRTKKEDVRTLIKILHQPKEGKQTLFKLYNTTPPTRTPEWTSLHHKNKFRSHYVIKSNVRITSSPPTEPPTEPSNHTIAWAHVTSNHSPIYVWTYYETYRLLSRHSTDWCLRWRRKHRQTLSQEKKADYIHSQRARKEGGRTLIKILLQPKEGTLSSNYITSLHQPKPPSEPPCITRAVFRSRHVILKDTYRLEVMHASDTNQATSIQTLLSPNALAIAPTATT